ncbi:MAG: glycine cleavage system protein GcvH [Planctomycetaceae bacterium]
MDPQSLKYAKTHEWLHLDGDIATVGISDFAVAELTDLVYIDFPDVGKQVAVGDVIGEVESVKAVSDLYSPVAGEVIEVNDALEEDLQVLSDDPYGKGWLVKFKVAEISNELLDKSAYDAHCQAESS